MGQVGSAEVSGSHSGAGKPQIPQPSTPTSTPPMPSIEDMRNITSRILASTSEGLKNIRENIPTSEPMESSSPTVSSTSNSEEIVNSGVLVAHVGSKEGLSAASGHILTETENSEKLFVFQPFTDSDNSNNISIVELTKMHYQYMVNWFKSNAKTVVLGIMAVGAVVVVGTITFNTIHSYRQKRRQRRVLKDKDGAKREIVVITNVATLEGIVLSLSLDQEGFVVFVGVPNQQRADEVLKWKRTDIHPVIVDTKKDDPFEGLVRAVSNFIDIQNSGGVSGDSSASSIYPMIYEEDISSSTSNIRIIHPEIKQRQHDKLTYPSFRLAAVIVNPYSAVYGSIENVDLTYWRQSIDTNITGTVVASQRFLPLLRRTLALSEPRRSPRLILVSSAITGSIGFPYQSAICASHHAIESIADSLRREIKPQGIDVICLRPGITDRSFRKDTKKHPTGVGFLGIMNPVNILTSLFKPVSTTSALCEVTYDAITSKKPAFHVRVGNSSVSYSFVGWAAPRSLVDWSTIGKSDKIFSPSLAKVTSPSIAIED